MKATRDAVAAGPSDTARSAAALPTGRTSERSAAQLRTVAAYIGSAALILGIAGAVFFAALYVDGASAPAPVSIQRVGGRLVAISASPQARYAAAQATGRSLETACLGVAIIGALILIVAIATGREAGRQRLRPGLAVFSGALAAICAAVLLAAAGSAPGGLPTAIGQLESNPAVLCGRPSSQGLLANAGMDIAVMPTLAAATTWQSGQAKESKSAVQGAMSAPGSFVAADGSHVRLLSSDAGFWRVRMEGGPHNASTGWVAAREIVRL